MKIIAFYLPQFHTFPENDKWWGKGFTEWTNTKKAQPLFKGHYQPHTPLDEKYYDLSDPKTMKTQVDLAKHYGIYGFCFYHYWFNGKLLMQKPVEEFLSNKTIDMPFCLCWANETWTRRWNGGKGKGEVLIKQEYGDENDWKEHFYYLLPFLKDKRYIRINDMPILLVYRPEIMPCYEKMVFLWKKLAKDNGLNGLYIMAQGSNYCAKNRYTKSLGVTDACIMYEPGYTIAALKQCNIKHFVADLIEFFPFNLYYYAKTIIRMLSCFIAKVCDYKCPAFIKRLIINRISYDLVWRTILKHRVIENYYPGAFVSWDNTARRKWEGRVVYGATPDKFRKYFDLHIKRIQKEYKKDYIFVTAWNEWAEGAHLEPDEKFKFGYLNAIKDTLMKNGEWE
ncbi:glycosyltransferase WbsX family protein [Butyrivibrio sp. XPD2006]|uniref:glycosyltransferase WbsX family protein n=1 Tax=Butyrivibrio sp. XPD2006 TaxID=1280668 RepID=UPI0003B3E0A1|nr:glycoside hydrolase family 99-like domain-containing protein [Butyrivibrio sp. XPD2006]